MVFEHRSFKGRTVAVVRSAWVAVVIGSLLAIPGSGGAQEPPGSAASTAAASVETPIPGETLTVHLLTIGPGDSVEQLFGHNVLLIRDSATRYEGAFNYGLFDPGESGFLLNFLRGRMMYRVEPRPLDATLASARADDRRIWAQELDLEPAARAELLDLLATASLPENRQYRYEYFLNNCSTKLRDALDTVLDGQLRAATDGPDDRGITWRHHTRRLTGNRLFYYPGIDLLLGPRGDEVTTQWQEMWVPMKLRDMLGGLSITRSDGSRTRLVSSEAVWVESDRENEPAASRSMEILFLLLGLTGGLAFVMLGRGAAGGNRRSRFGLGLLGCLWGVFCFVAGSLLIGMHWTDHEFMYWNQNVLLFSPLGIGVAIGLTRVSGRGTTGLWDRRAAIAPLWLAAAALLVHLIPPLRQGNLELILFAIPVHAAVCWVVIGIHRKEDSLIYT